MPENQMPAKNSPFEANVVGGVDFTIGSESSNVINVALQLNDVRGNAVGQRCGVFAYLSDDANGDSVVATAPDTVAIGTDGLAIETVADKAFQLISETDGDIDLDIGKTGADTYYLVVVLPDGTLVVSDAITFAA